MITRRVQSAIAIASLSLTFASAATWAQTAKPKGGVGGFAQAKAKGKVDQQQKPKSGWVARCSDGASGKFQCAMSQTLISAKSRRPLVTLVLSNNSGADPKAKKADVLWMKVAHGTFLPAGIVAAIDKDKPVRIPFVRSDNSGVYAPFRVTPDVLKKLRGGKAINLELGVGAKRVMKLSAPLLGFSKAYDRIARIN
ncbi:MAG: invasion associated locus B family protein [Pseudomonadota bacterium]